MTPNNFVKTALMTATLIAGLACLSPSSHAQETPRVISCLNADKLKDLFRNDGTIGLPHYREDVGARVQRQHPDTFMYLHTKYVAPEGRHLGICQYSNNVGIVAIYFVVNVQADATDGTSGADFCVGGAHWRKEWAESFEKDDKPGLEYTYTCMKDGESGQALPSGACGFSIPNPN